MMSVDEIWLRQTQGMQWFCLDRASPHKVSRSLYIKPTSFLRRPSIYIATHPASPQGLVLRLHVENTNRRYNMPENTAALHMHDPPPTVIPSRRGLGGR